MKPRTDTINDQCLDSASTLLGAATAMAIAPRSEPMAAGVSEAGGDKCSDRECLVTWPMPKAIGQYPSYSTEQRSQPSIFPADQLSALCPLSSGCKCIMWLSPVVRRIVCHRQFQLAGVFDHPVYLQFAGSQQPSLASSHRGALMRHRGSVACETNYEPHILINSN